MMSVSVRHATSRSRRADGIPVVSEATFEIVPSALTVIVGASGAGKSTLLDLVLGIAALSTGEVRIGSRRCNPAPRAVRERLRARTVASARQTGDLIDALTAKENVELGQRLAGRRDRAVVESALETLGLLPEIGRSPVGHLSGGERRRVAVARALASGSPVVCFDEPTSGLDERAARTVRTSLLRAAHDGRTVVAVTHDPELARRADRLVAVESGRVAAVLEAPSAEAVGRAMDGVL